MSKLNLKKEREALFTASLNRFVLIDVPPVRLLMVDGQGDPNSVPAYKRAVESLYATAYSIKFACKIQGRDFVVAPLEGLWSSPDPQSFIARRKHEWHWTMMIMVPDYVDQDSFAAAKVKSAAKLGGLPRSLRLAILEEGTCFQALHVGSYDDEGPLLAKLHNEIMPAGGYTFNGPHHEIYIGDPRKTAPHKLRTILRQPVWKE